MVYNGDSTGSHLMRDKYSKFKVKCPSCGIEKEVSELAVGYICVCKREVEIVKEKKK